MNLITIIILFIIEFGVWNLLVQRHDRPEVSAIQLGITSGWMTAVSCIYIALCTVIDPLFRVGIVNASAFGAINAVLALWILAMQNSPQKRHALAR